MLPEYADFMYSIGSLDANQRDYFKVQCDKAVWMISHGRWVDALKVHTSVHHLATCLSLCVCSCVSICDAVTPPSHPHLSSLRTPFAAPYKPPLHCFQTPFELPTNPLCAPFPLPSHSLSLSALPIFLFSFCNLCETLLYPLSDVDNTHRGCD